MSEKTEKTLDMENARLFRVRTVLLELKPNQEISHLNPVEIRAGAVRLGWASIYVEDCPGVYGRRLVADMVFSYATPERLSIETNAEKLYARIEGVMTMDAEPFEVVGFYHELLPEVREIHVLGLEISKLPGYYWQPSLGEAVL